MAGFTKGPWRACTGAGRGSCSCGHVWSEHAHVATAEWLGNYRKDSDEYPEAVELVTSDLGIAQANARLIAAAPELFDAAMAAKDHLIHELDEPGHTVFWQLVDALKKAGWSVRPTPRPRARTK